MIIDKKITGFVLVLGLRIKYIRKSHKNNIIRYTIIILTYYIQPKNVYTRIQI